MHNVPGACGRLQKARLANYCESVEGAAEDLQGVPSAKVFMVLGIIWEAEKEVTAEAVEKATRADPWTNAAGKHAGV